MANLAARDPNYAGPDKGSRWREGKPPGPGRPNRAWIRNRLRRASNAGGDNELVQILDHQIEVAKSWEVRIVGRDGDGEVIKVASGRDSTEAAKFVFGLIGLKPLSPGEEAVHVPDGMTVGNRPLLDVISDLVRHRLVSGQMTQAELQKWTDTFLSIDQVKLRLVLALLGKSASGKTPEEVARMVAGVEAMPTVASVVAPTGPEAPTPPELSANTAAEAPTPSGEKPGEAILPEPPSSQPASDAGLLSEGDE